MCYGFCKEPHSIVSISVLSFETTVKLSQTDPIVSRISRQAIKQCFII